MWEISASGQLLTVVYSIAGGAILAALYDVLRASRKCGHNGALLVFAEDVLFFAFSAFFVFFIMLAFTSGEIRGYLIFSVALGFLLFRITLSKLTFVFFCFCFNLLSKAFCLSDAVSRRICDGLSKAASFFYNKVKAFIALLKKVLKKGKRVLYNKENRKTEGEIADGGK